MKMSITISVTFLNTLCNLINKFDKTQNIHFSSEEKNKAITETKLAAPRCPILPPHRPLDQIYIFFFSCGGGNENK